MNQTYRDRRPPYWEKPLDLAKLALTLGGIMLMGLLLLQGCGASPAAPTIDPPAAPIYSRVPTALTGSAPQDTYVQIYRNQQFVGEAQTGPDGKWKFLLPASLAGSYTIDARASKDSVESDAATLKLDVVDLPVVPTETPRPPPTVAPTVTDNPVRPFPTQPPAATTVPKSITGPAEIKPGEKIALAGTGPVNSSVEVYENNVLLGKADTDASGKWTLEVPALTGGRRWITARFIRNGFLEDDRFLLFLNAPEAPAPAAAPAAEGAQSSGPTRVPPTVEPSLAQPQAGQMLAAGAVAAGDAPAGTIVRLFDGDQSLAEVKAGNDNKWSIPLTGLGEGRRWLIARFFNADGSALQDAERYLAVVYVPTATPVPPAIEAMQPTATELAYNRPQPTDGPTPTEVAYNAPLPTQGPTPTELAYNRVAMTPGPTPTELAYNRTVPTPAQAAAPANPVSPKATPKIIAALLSPATGSTLQPGAMGEMSGTAPDDTRVLIYSDNNLIGESTAKEGKWAFALPDLSAGRRWLTAQFIRPDGTTVDNDRYLIFVYVPEAQAAAPAPAAEAPKPTATELAMANRSGVPAPTIIPVVISTPPSGAVLLPGKMGNITGRAPAGAKVQVYDSYVFLAETVTDDSGNWTMALPELPEGRRWLTARFVNADGTPASIEPLLIFVYVPTATPVAGAAAPAAAPAATETPLPTIPPPTETPVPPTPTSEPTNTPEPTAVVAPTETPAAAAAAAADTATPVPPTETAVPPTETAEPTATAVPPTATAEPTATVVPATATALPTNTAVPPTATAAATATKVPPTPTQIPTATEVPATETPEPPTATPKPTNTAGPTLTPTATPIICTAVLSNVTAGITTTADKLSVLVGTAAPNSRIRVKDGDKVLGTVVTNARGVFALRLRSFLASGEHTLTPVLISRTGQELATCESTSFEIVVNPLLPTTGDGVEIIPIVPIVPIDATNTP